MRLIIALSVVVAACGANPAASAPPEPPPQSTPASPSVEIIGAPPPFTYWAPAGSRIEPHPTNPGVWIAKLRGQTRYYFGDGCGASRYQSYVGRKLEALPTRPEGAEWRFIDGAHNQDLRFGRLNIHHDAATRVITEIACH